MAIFSFEGEVAVVTGAASGIGRATAQALSAAGAAVALLDLPGTALEAAGQSLQDAGAQVLTVGVDVTDEAQVDSAIAEVEVRLGPLTLAVNAAGVAEAVPALDLDASRFSRMLDINVTGVFLCSRAEARRMIPRRRGAIVNLASISGHVSHDEMKQSHYNTSKAAVAHLTRSLATEWAPHGLRVNSVSPGFTLTPMNHRPEVADLREALSRKIPLARFANTEEVIAPILFLLSSAASYCTAADFVVDGGYTAL